MSVSTIQKDNVVNTVTPKSLIVPLDNKRKTATNTMYVTPGIEGHIVSYRGFGNLFSSQWCLFGLLFPNFEGEHYDSLEDIAKRLCLEITSKQKEGPYYLFGHSLGCIINLEIARLLKASGKEVILLFVEARILECAPQKALSKRLIVHLKYKPRIILKKLLQKLSISSASKAHENNKPDQDDAENVDISMGAFNLTEKQLQKYKTTRCDVPAILVMGDEKAWWDEFREWPQDYGVGKFVNLISVCFASGDHVSIVMNKSHRKTLAHLIESELQKVHL